MEDNIQNVIQSKQNTFNITRIPLTGTPEVVEIRKYPVMGFIFLKACLISPFRHNTIKDDIIVNKTSIILNHYQPNKELIEHYCKICSFSKNRSDFIPISYLQTLFIGLLGKFITSSFFPLNPLGLIHIYQSFDQKRPVAINEFLDLVCTLTSITKTERGIETAFTLKIVSKRKLVWKGVSIFLTKNGGKRKKSNRKKRGKRKYEHTLDIKESIPVPADTGRKYAKVSGDYNPHHLYGFVAKIFGFKTTIAHGMWTLARAVASLERKFDINSSAAFIEASFKLPVFIPSTIVLGYEIQGDSNDNQTAVNFELRNNRTSKPHLKGNLLVKPS